MFLLVLTSAFSAASAADQHVECHAGEWHGARHCGRPSETYGKSLPSGVLHCGWGNETYAHAWKMK